MNYGILLDYWFSAHMKKHWFNSTQAIDNDIRERFLPTWEAALRHELDGWLATDEGALAMIILLDQLPLNMFRGQVKSFSTEQLAVKIARQAINQGLDKTLDSSRQVFMYMPFMHSENMNDQDKSVALFKHAGMQESLKFAEHHRSIVQQFGRFPHRNAILGRRSTEKELVYLASDEAFRG